MFIVPKNSTGTFLRPSFISSRCPCKRKHSSRQLSLKIPHWRFLNRHLLGMCFIISKHSWINLLRSAANYLLSTQTQSLLCVYSCHPSIFTHFPLSFISLLALSLSRWLRALFSHVCFAPSFSFSVSFISITHRRLWGGGGEKSPLGRVASKRRCFSRKCFFMLSGVCLR